MSFTQADLQAALSYHDDGHLYWRITRGSRAIAGQRAGSLGFNGYWTIRFKGKPYYEHRLVFFWHTGRWPAQGIDHKDKNKWNNRIENLREANASQNGANSVLFNTNTSGAKCVSWNKRLEKWHAYAMKDRKRIHVGFFVYKQDAELAANDAAVKLHGDFASIGEQQ